MDEFPVLIADASDPLLIIGIAVDSAFGAADNRLRRRYGLVDSATPR